MESRKGLTGSSSHYEQQTFVATCNGIKRAVDSDTLIVTRFVSGFAIVIRNSKCFFLLLVQLLLYEPTLLELLMSWELIHVEIAFLSGYHVMFTER